MADFNSTIRIPLYFKNHLVSLNFAVPNPFNDGLGACLQVILSTKNSDQMANHKATKKDVRQATKRKERNRYYGKTTRNVIRDLKELKVKKEAGEKFPEVESMIDKMAKRGIIHKNKAANLKSKLSKRINALAK
jgi:small subunit ribosomal protein S20